MSFADRSGAQLDPDDVQMYAAAVTVWIAGEPVTIPTSVMCAEAGVGPDEYGDALASLVVAGFLAPLPDGTYQATLPGGGAV